MITRIRKYERTVLLRAPADYAQVARACEPAHWSVIVLRWERIGEFAGRLRTT